MQIVFNTTELYILQEVLHEQPAAELDNAAELERIETALLEYCKSNPDNCTDARAILDKITAFLTITE